MAQNCYGLGAGDAGPAPAGPPAAAAAATAATTALSNSVVCLGSELWRLTGPRSGYSLGMRANIITVTLITATSESATVTAAAAVALRLPCRSPSQAGQVTTEYQAH